MTDMGTFKKSGIPILYPGSSVFGNTWFVDASASDSNDGKTPDKGVAKIETGVSRAGENGTDATVLVRQGFYQPASVMALTSSHNGIRILADHIMPLMAGKNTKIYNIGGPDQIFTLNGAHNVEIAGFRMWPEMAQTATGIDIGGTTGCVGTWIHDNAIINVEAAEMACSVRMGTAECQYILIEDNLFHCGGSVAAGTGIIDWTLATRSMVRNNHFDIIRNAATSCGIFVSNAAAPRGRIVGNYFNGTEVGVADMVAQAVYTAQAMTAGDFQIVGNHTVNLAAPFNAYVLLNCVLGLNYINETAAVSA